MAYGEANTSMRAPVLFDLYMEKVAAAARGEDVGLGVDLAGRVDLNRLAVLGHSMGGTAVDTIMADRAGQTGPEQVDAGQGPVAAAFLLAPFEYSDAKKGLTVPQASRDLSGYESLQLPAVVDPLSDLNPEGQPQAFSVRLRDGLGAPDQQTCSGLSLRVDDHVRRAA